MVLRTWLKASLQDTLTKWLNAKRAFFETSVREALLGHPIRVLCWSCVANATRTQRGANVQSLPDPCSLERDGVLKRCRLP